MRNIPIQLPVTHQRTSEEGFGREVVTGNTMVVKQPPDIHSGNYKTHLRRKGLGRNEQVGLRTGEAN